MRDDHPVGGVRERLIEAAVALLATEGPGAIQARSLARRIGASTTAVYHHFGGMPQLVDAVSDEGFQQLDARLAAVPHTDDPIADLARLGVAYRDAAHANPHLYDLMFGLSAPGGYRPQPKPGVGSGDAGPIPGAAFGRLVDASARAIDAGRLNPVDPEHVAARLWALLHGVVTLELAGMLGDLDAVNDLMVPLAAHVLVGLGDAPERLGASAAAVFGPTADS